MFSYKIAQLKPTPRHSAIVGLFVVVLIILSGCDLRPQAPRMSLNLLTGRADQLMADRRYSEAAITLEDAALIYTDSSIPVIKLGQIYLKQQRWLLAEDAFNRALARDANDALATAGLAEALLNQGDTTQAAKLWQKAIRLNPNLPGVHTGLGRTHIANFNFEAATDAFIEQQAHHFDPEAQWFLAALTAPSDIAAANHYLLAIPPESSPDLLARRDYLLSTLIPFTKASPQVEIAKATGIALVQVELWPLAVHALSLAAENLDALSTNEQAETLAFLGHALAQAGRPALDMFERAQTLNPESALPIFFYGIYLRQQGALKAAEEAFNQAIKLDPQNAAFYVELATTKAEQGVFTEAEEHYTTAANLAENNLQLQLARVRFYTHRGYKVAEAGIPAAEELIEKNPDNAEIHGLLGWMQFLSGEPEQAEASLRRAIELDPNLMSARYHLARLLAANGQSAAALAEYQRIVDWDSSGTFRARALQDMQQLRSSQ